MKKHLIRLSVGLLALGVMGTTAIPNAAMAQERPEVKMLVDNDKVRVYESRYRPGAEGPNVARNFRVVRALMDGTIQRTYPDGKTELVQWKAGEVRTEGPDKPMIPKNVGKSDFVVYVVEPK